MDSALGGSGFHKQSRPLAPAHPMFDIFVAPSQSASLPPACLRRSPTWAQRAAPALLAALALALVPACKSSAASSSPSPQELRLLNVSYDPTRELYDALNPLFSKQWQTAHGQTVTVAQSHGGSGKQARAVIDGLEADVVTLALAYDIDAISTKGRLLAQDWQARLPQNSTPFTSTVVFLVRKGNPKGIKDWSDLAKTGVQVITPNPKTSGGARWNYLAAWGYALRQPGGNEDSARSLLQGIFANVPVLDSGARGSTITFVERKIGDVLLAWENEALLSMKKLGPGQFELVVPSISILAEPPVAVVDKYSERHGTRQLAEGYLRFLYTKEAQAVAAQHFYRPTDPEVLAKNADKFPAITLFPVKDLGGWSAVQAKHFADGGVFDQIAKR